MSLTVAIRAAQLGIAQAERKIAVAASNINNADRYGYTRKTLVNDYIFNGIASLPVGGQVVQAVVNPLLVKQVIQQSTRATFETTISTYLSAYGQAFGGTGANANNIQSGLDTLMANLNVLEANPGDQAAKAMVVTQAQLVSSTFNGLSQNVQSERLRANNDIANSVATINQTLERIAALNREIGVGDASGASFADLVDERNVALENLAKQMDLQYFISPQNQAMVYTRDGSSLVTGSGFATLAYDPVGVVTSTTAYPGGFPPITLNGTDITASVRSGRLGSLVALRDTLLPSEQAKLDMLADTMRSSVNRILNQGATYPPLQTITGTEVVTAGTAFAGTGNLRVAVLDANGFVTNYTDINITGTPTVGALVTALNGIAGVNATINANGFLEVTATSATGRISMNPLNTNVGGISATQFFGFNNLFTQQIGVNGAPGITVNTNLVNNYNALATGTLSASATLAAGDVGLTSGDVTTTRTLIDVMRSPQPFAVAGNFSARNATLASYAGAIIADIATQASAAKNQADTANATYTYLSNNLGNASGVNIDEESANLTVLQTAYQANAQVIATIRQLFDSLINAVR